ncbi:hypothetical protein OIO90_003222 [Microbotryomycetes sp. JL221]|nr:hypothetical protein OIO90_003222 [Microbotryomycetes sp. JL221]
MTSLLQASPWPACVLRLEVLHEALAIRQLLLNSSNTPLGDRSTSMRAAHTLDAELGATLSTVRGRDELQTPMERFKMHSPDLIVSQSTPTIHATTTAAAAGDYFSTLPASPKSMEHDEARLSPRMVEFADDGTAGTAALQSQDGRSIAVDQSGTTATPSYAHHGGLNAATASLASRSIPKTSRQVLDSALQFVNEPFVRLNRRRSSSQNASRRTSRGHDGHNDVAMQQARPSHPGFIDDGNIEDDDDEDEAGDDGHFATEAIRSFSTDKYCIGVAQSTVSSRRSSLSGFAKRVRGANFGFLSSQDQDDLLAFVLDLCEAVDDAASQCGPCNHSAVQLESVAFSATAVPPGNVVLQAVPAVVAPTRRAPPSPPPPLATDRASLTRSSHTSSNGTYQGSSSRRATATMLDSDWTDDDRMWVTQVLETTPMGRMIRDYAWRDTELGPISSWCPELRTMVSSILASHNRECILWGPNRIMIYNDEYVECAMGKHPGLLGKAAASQEGWAEIWDGLEPVAVRVMEGETVSFNEHYLPMVRQGYTEETYHTFSYQPFYDAKGQVLGIRNLSIENTAAVIATRRLETVRDLIQTTSLARTVQDFADMALESISHNPYDVPFCSMYTVTPATTTANNNDLSKRQVKTGSDNQPRMAVSVDYAGSLGIPEDHPFLIRHALVDVSPPMSRQSSTSGSCSTATILDDDEVGKGWCWPFEDACLRKEAVFIDSLGPLADTLHRRGWEEPPRSAVAIPIFVDAAQSIPQAIMVLGINPRSSYNELYATFLNLLARHIAVGLFAVMTAEIDAKRAEDLVRLDKAKTSFFNNVSHELRTPLTLILGPLEDVLNSKELSGSDNKDKLKLVQRHANRLLGLVNKLLDFSSLEGGRMQVKFRPVQLGYITRDLSTLFRDTVERNGLTYKISCDDDPPDCMPIYIALDLWDKVVFNLIGNAVKYCPSGSIEVSLRLTLAGAVFSVKDTGVGIPREDLTRIFERFHRVDSTARTTSGTGIGLALTLEIVKLLGGQMEVESEPGRGSTFSVHLPRGFIHLPIEQVSHEPDSMTMALPTGRNLAIIEEAAAWKNEERDRESSEANSLGSVNGDSESASGTSGTEEFIDSTRGLLSLKNRTVLVVEDSPDMRNYLTSILARSFNVVSMPDGLAALEYAIKNPPNLIVTDQMMPRMTGNELAAALRANPVTALLPIIMLSAQAGSEARAEALERGLDDYLCKPFQARELLARVNVHLQLGLMRIELEKRVEERTSAFIKSEAQNRALADKFSTLSAVSPVGILQADADGNIVYANPRFFDITGHPFDQPLSEWRKCVWDEDQAKLDAYHALVVSGQSYTAEWESLEIRFKNREDNWGQFDVRPYRDVDGRPGFVAAVTDISRQKRAEALHVQTVEARRVEADENRRNTEAFLDMSSHELRNPLSGVWQNAEVLAGSLENVLSVIEQLCSGKQVDPQTLESIRRELVEDAESVESILICASHQGRIADDILTVSKLNMGLLSIIPIPFDLPTRMNQVLRMFEAEAVQKKIALGVSVSESVDRLGARCIVADPSRLAQVLLNFLSNSIKYTSEAPCRRITVQIDAYDGPPPERTTAMRISQPQNLALAPGHVWVSVGCQDSGKGLSADELKKLFARFTQANPRSDQYTGHGLGLFINKALAERHSGFIEVESLPGAGSTFRFLIPAKVADTSFEELPLPSLPPLGTVPQSRTKRARPGYMRQPSAKNQKLVNTTDRPVHILIVEDNAINQKVLSRQLKLAGFSVTIANNGREGLDFLLAEITKQPNESPIAGVLMDIEMPVMSGLEAIRSLRQMERQGEMPWHYNVIAVTGNARKAQIDQCLEAGFEDS